MSERSPRSFPLRTYRLDGEIVAQTIDHGISSDIRPRFQTLLSFESESVMWWCYRKKLGGSFWTDDPEEAEDNQAELLTKLDDVLSRAADESEAPR